MSVEARSTANGHQATYHGQPTQRRQHLQTERQRLLRRPLGPSWELYQVLDLEATNAG